jgi:threonine/homoserine/homoserine lactone efflux protein
MLALITRGATLGLTAGVLPGPLQTYLIQTTLTQGWRKSLPLVLSPLIADIPVILLTTVILSQVPPELIRAIQIIGGVFVLWLARAAWLSFRAGAGFGEGGEVLTLSVRQLLTRAVMVNLLSPGPYIFWATVNGPLLVQGLRESVLHGVAFMVAFYGTFLAMLVAFIVVFDRVRALDPRVTRALLLVITVVLVVFGVSLVGQGVGLIPN